MSLILATDLDGTLAGGTAADRARLVERLHAAAATLVYVTGRTPDGARTVISAADLPEPAVLIADVGTTVLRGLGPDAVPEIERELDRLWPGGQVVRERLAGMQELTEQDIVAPRRVSWWIEPVRLRRNRDAAAGDDVYAARAPDDASLGADAARVAERVGAAAAAALRGLSVDVLVSANVFLDVLPQGVHKGSTLRRVLEWLGVEGSDCVVAGDSLNDLALFDCGFRGIAVGNAEPALLGRIEGRGTVYRARGEGAAGVLEGLRHHGYLEGGDHGE